MKYINKLFQLLWKLKPFSYLLDGFVFFGNYLHTQHRILITRPIRKELDRLFVTPYEVLQGPFKGMRYANMKAIGSTIYPKLTGTYEKELHDVIESLIALDLEEIWDIGCAEGYYAVGLALTNKNAQVRAYDISPKAQKLCTEMAKLNEVESRVQVRGAAIPSDFKTISSNKRTLVLSDCEGFEKTLFTEQAIPCLEFAYVLIEAHDLFDIEITPTLKKLFEPTHEVTLVSSVDDIQKAHNYEFKASQKLSLEHKKELFAERRGSCMQWIFAVPRKVKS